MFNFTPENFESLLADSLARNMKILKFRLEKLYVTHIEGADSERFREVLNNITDAIEQTPAFRENYDVITLISYLDGVAEVFQGESESAKDKIEFKYLFVAMTSLCAVWILGRKRDYYNLVTAFSDAHHFAGASEQIEKSIPDLVEQKKELIAKLSGSKGGAAKAKNNDEPREKVFLEFCQIGRKFHSHSEAVSKFSEYFNGREDCAGLSPPGKTMIGRLIKKHNIDWLKKPQ